MMSGTRRLVALVASVIPLFGLSAGCATSPGAVPISSSNRPSVAVRIASLKGPTTMGLVKLMSDAASGSAAADYHVTMHGSPDEIVPGLVKGEIDVALVPANLAAVLYNKTEGAVQLLAINTLGVLYVVESGDSVHRFGDLKGRKVYSTGKGTSPEYVLNYLLERNGLDPARDLTVEYKSESTELAAMLQAGKATLAVLPQPFVTVVQAQNPKVRVALDLTREWSAVSPESGLITGVAVVRKEFAQANPSVVGTFLADYRASTEFTNSHVSDAAQLIVKAGIVPSAPIAEKAIPTCNITFIDGAEMKSKVSGYLQVLFDANPASVGGAMPGDDFYYQS